MARKSMGSSKRKQSSQSGPQKHRRKENSESTMESEESADNESLSEPSTPDTSLDAQLAEALSEPRRTRHSASIARHAVRMQTEEAEISCAPKPKKNPLVARERLEELMRDPKYDVPVLIKQCAPKDLLKEAYDADGFSRVMVFTCPPEHLGMKMVDDAFDVHSVEKAVGSNLSISVVEVTEQKDMSMNMKTFQEYYHMPAEQRKDRLNVLSLEFSNTAMEDMVRAPSLVGEIDWVKQCWPDWERQRYVKFHKNGDFELAHRFPKVQNYCLMSVEHCYTDFHIDFHGTSVWYHVKKGKKVFWIVEPTEHNIQLYEEHQKMRVDDEDTFFGDVPEQCHRVVLEPGMTLIIPSGWIHAVYTPVDSLVFGGNFLHSRQIKMQIRVLQSENRINVTKKFRFPYSEELVFYMFSKLVRDVSGREYVRPGSRNQLGFEYCGELFREKDFHHHVVNGKDWATGLREPKQIWEEHPDYLKYLEKVKERRGVGEEKEKRMKTEPNEAEESLRPSSAEVSAVPLSAPSETPAVPPSDSPVSDDTNLSVAASPGDLCYGLEESDEEEHSEDRGERRKEKGNGSKEEIKAEDEPPAEREGEDEFEKAYNDDFDDFFYDDFTFYHPPEMLKDPPTDRMSSIHLKPVGEEPKLQIDPVALHKTLPDAGLVQQLEFLVAYLRKKRLVDVPHGLTRPNSLIKAVKEILLARRTELEKEGVKMDPCVFLLEKPRNLRRNKVYHEDEDWTETTEKREFTGSSRHANPFDVRVVRPAFIFVERGGVSTKLHISPFNAFYEDKKADFAHVASNERRRFMRNFFKQLPREQRAPYSARTYHAQDLREYFQLQRERGAEHTLRQRCKFERCTQPRSRPSCAELSDSAFNTYYLLRGCSLLEEEHFEWRERERNDPEKINACRFLYWISLPEVEKAKYSPRQRLGITEASFQNSCPNVESCNVPSSRKSLNRAKEIQTSLRKFLQNNYDIPIVSRSSSVKPWQMWKADGGADSLESQLIALEAKKRCPFIAKEFSKLPEVLLQRYKQLTSDFNSCFVRLTTRSSSTATDDLKEEKSQRESREGGDASTSRINFMAKRGSRRGRGNGAKPSSTTVAASTRVGWLRSGRGRVAESEKISKASSARRHSDEEHEAAPSQSDAQSKAEVTESPQAEMESTHDDSHVSAIDDIEEEEGDRAEVQESSEISEAVSGCEEADEDSDQFIDIEGGAPPLPPSLPTLQLEAPMASLVGDEELEEAVVSPVPSAPPDEGQHSDSALPLSSVKDEAFDYGQVAEESESEEKKQRRSTRATRAMRAEEESDEEWKEGEEEGTTRVRKRTTTSSEKAAVAKKSKKSQSQNESKMARRGSSAKESADFMHAVTGKGGKSGKKKPVATPGHPLIVGGLPVAPIQDEPAVANPYGFDPLKDIMPLGKGQLKSAWRKSNLQLDTPAMDGKRYKLEIKHDHLDDEGKQEGKEEEPPPSAAAPEELADSQPLSSPSSSCSVPSRHSSLSTPRPGPSPFIPTMTSPLARRDFTNVSGRNRIGSVGSSWSSAARPVAAPIRSTTSLSPGWLPLTSAVTKTPVPENAPLRMNRLSQAEQFPMPAPKVIETPKLSTPTLSTSQERNGRAATVGTNEKVPERIGGTISLDVFLSTMVEVTNVLLECNSVLASSSNGN